MKQFIILHIVFFGMNSLSTQFIQEKKDLKLYYGYFNF